MLYVFLVNNGSMLSFDMQLAMSSVNTLKRRIAERCDITVDKQVLLISGGEWLDGGARVGSYPAGTDTSPIFLFSKLSDPADSSVCDGTADNSSVISTATDVGDSDDSVRAQVAGALLLPSSFSTIVSRSQLAQQLYERGKQQMQLCDRLIREQHLQQQGWSAAVANMDDLTQSLQTSADRFQLMYEQYLQDRPRQLQLLESFGSDIQLLARIPLLERLEAAVTPAVAESEKESRAATLLDWISAQDSSKLQDVCDKARAGIDRLDDEFLQRLRVELDELLNPAMCANMAEIGGLEGRLMRLDKLRHDARQVLAEQMELARAFVQNQTRASCVNDPSVLPDLCQSHCTQLEVMLAKHGQLTDTRRRCARAKDELSANINTRLGWVVSVQRRMTDLCSRLVIYSERLKQLRQQLGVLAALHAAPRVYCRAAGEVVRRRVFSSGYMTWAREVSSAAATTVSAEKRCRKRFAELLGTHFLTGVFPGLEAMPPDFAVECPLEFDNRLPPLDSSDLTVLRDAVPEMSDLLQPPAPEVATAVCCDTQTDSMNTICDMRAAGCCTKQLDEVRQYLDHLKQLVSQQLHAFSVQLGDQCAAVGDRVSDMVSQCQRLQLAASEASTCVELAEARAEEQAALLTESERRCAEIVAELESERAADTTARTPSTKVDSATVLTAQHEEHLQRVRTEFDSRLERELAEQRERLNAQWQSSLDDQRRQLQQQHDQQLANLRGQHRNETLALRARFRSMTAHLSSGAGVNAVGSGACGGDSVVSSAATDDRDGTMVDAEMAIRHAENLRRDNVRLRDQLTRSAAALLERGQLSVLSCSDGDAVLVVWDAERRHYRVYQENSPLLYFVHADSYAALALSTSSPGVPAYFTAQVVSHEFCQAKKDGNRYRVARGTRFYRVKLQPWNRARHSSVSSDIAPSSSPHKISECSADSAE